MQAKIIAALKSRTFWSAVLLFVVSGIDGVRESIPAVVLEPLQVVLTLAVGYFRVNTKQ